jgi:hypothetical protein
VYAVIVRYIFDVETFKVLPIESRAGRYMVLEKNISTFNVAKMEIVNIFSFSDRTV